MTLCRNERSEPLINELIGTITVIMQGNTKRGLQNSVGTSVGESVAIAIEGCAVLGGTCEGTGALVGSPVFIS
jgi:hypothetical protein